MSRKQNAVRNTFFGLINKFVILLFPFVIRTIILKTLSTEYVGLSGLFSSILSVLNMAELGVGSAIVYTMYKPTAEEDNAQICALLNLYKTFYRIIGICILVIGLCLLPFMKRLISGDVPDGINIYILFLIYLANTVSSYLLFAYRSSLLTAHQRSDITSNINTICELVMYIVQIVCLLLLKNYYIYIIWLPIFTAINNIIVAIITKRKYPELNPIGFPPKEQVEDLSKNVAALFGHKLGGIVLNSCDSIFISAFLGLFTLAVYNNYYYILSAVMGVLNMFYVSVTAGIGDSLVRETKEKNYDTFNVLLFMNSWITCWCTVCFLCLFQPFMKIWVGTDLMYGMDTVILFAIYFFSWNIRKIPLTYKDAAGMWKADALKPYISIVVDLVLNFILINFIGVNGIIIATIVTMTLVNMPWEVQVVYKGIFQKKSFEFYVQLIKFILVMAAACAVTWWVCSLITVGEVVALILKLVVCIIIPNVIFAVIFCRNKDFRVCVSMLLSMKTRR